MDVFFNWITSNEPWLSITIAAISTALTFILTLIIICQTNSLNKKQQELEEKINHQQEELQKRQLKLDIYPYKREIYVNVYAVLSFCSFLSDNFKEEFLMTKSCEEIGTIYKTIQTSFVPDPQQTLWCLREAEYIFSEETANVILDIRKNFDILGSRMIAPNAVETIVKGAGLNIQDTIDKMKEANIHTALDCSKKILGYLDYIEKELPKELRIVDVDK